MIEDNYSWRAQRQQKNAKIRKVRFVVFDLLFNLRRLHPLREDGQTDDDINKKMTKSKLIVIFQSQRLSTRPKPQKEFKSNPAMESKLNTYTNSDEKMNETYE